MKTYLTVGLLMVCLAANAEPASSSTATSASIPWGRIDVKTSADYKGNGLAVIPTAGGARLRSAFQRLDGEVTREGLWLTSISIDKVKDRFRVMAAEVGRMTEEKTSSIRLPPGGAVTVDGQSVRFSRVGLLEEYSVSLDGVRQDFVVTKRPVGPGKLRVRLDVAGAQVLSIAKGIQLALEASGRRIAYNRLQVIDATGKELDARFVVDDARELSVEVDDIDAAYPVRIDPTFSDANWISMGSLPGTDGSVYAAVVDGPGNLYIGGHFSVIGAVAANNIAKWDGTNWSSLGLGLDYWVETIVVSGNELYVGGVFDWATNSGGASVPVSGIARWDGNSWSAVGLGVNGSVESLAILGNDLYVGGAFNFVTNSGGTIVPVSSIAKWNGSMWSSIGRGVNGIVYSLLASGSEVFVGGFFTRATNTSGGSILANSIAKWNGTSWSALGLGLIDVSPFPQSRVEALVTEGNNLYAGGRFTLAGGVVNATNIARWDRTNWYAVGTGINGTVFALGATNGQLFAGGIFETAGGLTVNNVTVWNGNDWLALGSGMIDGHVHALVPLSTNKVYAGGSITVAGGNAARGITQWSGTNWSALSPSTGINNTVRALAVSGRDVYVAGEFTMAGAIAANCIAKWDGSNWSTLGSEIGGMDSSFITVRALAVSGNRVYAGGDFTTAGGVIAHNIAKWDGTNWSALGGGLNARVLTLAELGGDLYVGGEFTTATNTDGSSVIVNQIAKWNGSTWSALGSGFDGGVFALAVLGNELYAGGTFTTTNGNSIAIWNGSSWSDVYSPIDFGAVFALAFDGTNLFGGGGFTSIGGILATNIARWDGATWSALGPGLIDPDNPYESGVEALLVSGADLYAGGNFTTAGGISVVSIAKWDGSSWSGLGSGMSGSYWGVYALALMGSDLYAGGVFRMVGGKVSTCLGKAIVNPGNWLTLQSDVPGSHTNTLTYVGVPNEQYLLRFATNLTTSPWFRLATNTPAANGRGTVLDSNATNAMRFYRVGTLWTTGG